MVGVELLHDKEEARIEPSLGTQERFTAMVNRGGQVQVELLPELSHKPRELQIYGKSQLEPGATKSPERGEVELTVA
jgi:hypothetical protein